MSQKDDCHFLLAVKEGHEVLGVYFTYKENTKVSKLTECM
jgi:hypothetical protein